MRQPIDLTQSIVVMQQENSEWLTFTLRSKNGYPFGKINMVYVAPKVWTVHNNAQHGWGPLLYDLAIEYATKNGGGVIPATGAKAGMNTPESNSVWKYYYEKRSDVNHKPIQIDDDEYPQENPWLFQLYTKYPQHLDALRRDGRLLTQEQYEQSAAYRYSQDKMQRTKNNQAQTDMPAVV